MSSKINENLLEVNTLLKEAIIQYNRKNIEEAKLLFSQVLDSDPVNPEANYYLGLIYSKEENYKKAVIYLKSVVDTGINFLFTQQCRMILGYIYFKNTEYKRAEYEFKEVMKSNLEIIQVYAALAAIYHKLQEKENALKFAEKAYNLDPYNLNAKNTFAYLLCDYNIDIQKALELLREVIRIKPDNPAYLDSLGWAYYKKGDIKASLASLKKALEISDNNPEIKEHYDIVVKKMKGF
ncbi:MAG TPA: tetratricopeptide repeat protein [Spirochaetota bacterium]|nr:tetratricopeptide repeat protein [Spirochaetota bacterium]HOL57068.1 tetratricopeptide repeat protein [Spirochaetota bacterium]HPP04590.1 tetratricopeptide repeat protein [Spirochaetota bacterium]